DGTANSNVAAVNLTINPVDDPPVAVDDSATVLEDASATSIDVLANDTDIDGGPKFVASVTQPANGTVVITGGGSGLTYQPNDNYCNDGSPLDTFTYALNGGSTATVSVTVTCVNDPPSFTKGADQLNQPNQNSGGNPKAYTVAGWATNISAGPPNESGQTLTFHVSNDNNNLFTVQPAVDPTSGDLTFTTDPAHTGSATVSVYLTDNGGTANGGNDTSGTPTFTISTVFPPPDAVDDGPPPDYSATGGVSIDIGSGIGVLSNDTLFGGSIASYGASTGNEQTTIGAATPTAQGGSVKLNANGSFHYEPPSIPPAGGTDTFKYKLTNGGGSDTATVTLNVTNQIIFVDGAANSVPETGSIEHPYNSLGDVPSGRNTGGVLFFYSGSYTRSDADGVTLKNNESLIGQGVALGSNLPFTLAPQS